MIQLSIIMPVYNAENFIFHAVKSVLNQTFRNFEFLIYDDACTDKSFEIIKQFNDKRIKIFSDNENKGIVERLNYLVGQSQCELIARMDADDIWYPKKLEQQIVFLKENPQCQMIGAFARPIDETGRPHRAKLKQFSNETEIRKHLPAHNFIIHASVMFRKEMFYEIGRYRSVYLHAEDYDLWLRMLDAKIPFSILSEILMDYRISNESINWKFRKCQNRNVIRLKKTFYRKNGFKCHYMKELLRNYYYWFLL